MTPEEIYAEVGGLIKLLRSNGNEKLPRILEHRLYEVSWTSSTELLENIASILNKHITGHESTLDKVAVIKARSIIKEIETIVRD